MDKSSKAHSDDRLEWTISNAPTDGEIPSPEPSSLHAHDSETPHAHAHRITRQTWIILGGLIMAAVLVAGLYFTWGRYRLGSDVARIVTAEDEAALAGDIERLHQLSDQSNTGWLNERDQLASLGQPAPPPTRLLRPVREPGVVRSFTTITQNIARADVARKYVAPDGTTFTFILPQFYRFADGQWKRIPPLEDLSEQQSTRTGTYADIKYFAADADFVENDLGPYLDDVLARACALWDCPANLKIVVNFIRYTSPYGPSYSQQPALPLLFQLSPITFSRWPQNTLTLVSPQLIGYPADTASTDHLKRVAAIQALLVLADRLIGGADQTHNGFFYALVARASVRLGLDSPSLLGEYNAPFSLTAADLWHGQRNSGIVFDALPPDDMQRALVILNWLLRDQPASVDFRLLSALTSTQNPVDWMATGLGISADEARARLGAAETNTYQLELDYHVAALSQAHYDLALGCDDGPALLSLSEAQPFYFLPDYHAQANILSWSPNGQRLLINLAEQPAVVDLATQTVYALPNVPSGNHLEARWISESRIAYMFWFSSAGLNFFDVEQPQASLSPITATISLYVVSPDKSRAAVVGQVPVTSGGDTRSEVDVMPVPQGPLTPVDVGWWPSWSPDGQSIAYTHFDPAVGGFSLRIADLTTGITRTLVTAVDLGINTVNQFDQTTWSPAGDKIAFTASTEMSSWIGLVNPNGSALPLLLDRRGFGGSVDTLRFSADGKFLATLLYDSRSLPATTIFDVTTGKQVATLPYAWIYDWSPSGHWLVAAKPDGVFLLADPASPPQKLADGSCYNAAWNPAP
jgi:WD40 repeat protein